MSTEPEDPLEQPRFSYRATKDDAVHISYRGRTIKHLKGSAAARFLRRVENTTIREQQLAMAKATGHFKQGNERSAKPRG